MPDKRGTGFSQDPGQRRPGGPPPPVFIVSGGVGSSGEHIVNTVLAQFPDAGVPVVIVGNVRTPDQVGSAIEQAEKDGGIIVHTMVDAGLRAMLKDLALKRRVPEIDLMGPLMDLLSAALGREPEGRPGLYGELRRDYFERISAMDYTISHDDGRGPGEWNKADVLIIGVSRTGKTPLSVYLSVLGWRVANCPIVPGVPLPGELSAVESSRVVGLTIDPERLLIIRRRRLAAIGANPRTEYTDPARVEEEMREARRIFRSQGFWVLDMTDRTIEAGADEIIRRVARIVG
jgi:regulator of PEP synthase PpsR (kinase-PPPase family)